MAEKKEKRMIDSYHKMSRKDLTGIVEDLHKMDHDERMEHTNAALTGYQESGVIDSEYNKTSAEIEFGKKADTMKGLYKKLHDEHTDKKGDLETTTTTTWLRKFANEVMPSMHMGAEGHEEENYQNLMRYLSEYDQINKGQTNIAGEIRALIKKGKGHAATARIIEAIASTTKNRELNNFMDLLLPDDHYEFIQHASKKIANDINKTLKGKQYEVSAVKVSENFTNIYQHYAYKDYKTIVKNCQIQKKKAV